MKFALYLLALVLGCNAITEEDALRQWQDYQVKYDKTFSSPDEHNYRFELFKQKLQEIEEHNKLYAEGKVSWYKGLTDCTTWTREEYNSYAYNNTIEEFNGDEEIFDSTNITVPNSIDWRIVGAVSEVKDQGTCGSCWTFSSTGALEGAYKIKYNVLLSLSEQNLMDCATEAYNCNGCGGGNNVGAFTYVRDYGIAREADYPYTGVQGTCKSVRPAIRATGLVRVPPTENDLLKAVGSVGPISAYVYSGYELHCHYGGGIFDDASCAGQNINHVILVVGYGSENGKDYWIIKNSWGPNWGEHGYWRMIRGKNSCGINQQLTYPLV